jgi:hypothetical protein
MLLGKGSKQLAKAKRFTNAARALGDGPFSPVEIVVLP